MTPNTFPRKKIAIRLLYTVFFLIVFEILKIIIQVSVIFQYVYLLISKTHNNPIRNFSNKVSVYAYRVLRYVTLNENKKPFPFQDFPKEFELPETEVLFE
jgi:D-alanyl-lipoteichoic acid acyltransferase DltB (MBOAT superfamily)